MKRELMEQFLARAMVEGALDEILRKAGVTREDLKEGRVEFDSNGNLCALNPANHWCRECDCVGDCDVSPDNQACDLFTPRLTDPQESSS